MLVRRNIHIEETQTKMLEEMYKASGKKSSEKPATLVRRAIDEFIANHPEKLPAKLRPRK